MIVKHRRGTTKEWQEVDLIPEEGELVFEECIDGSIKCKVGTGYTKFSRLPYIDDKTKRTLLQEVATTKAELESKITSLEGTIAVDLSVTEQQLEEAIETKSAELTNEFTAKHNYVMSELEQGLRASTTAAHKEVVTLASSVTTSLNQTKDEFNTNLAELSSALDSTKSALEASIAEEKLARESAVEALQYNIDTVEYEANRKIQAAEAALSADIYTGLNKVAADADNQTEKLNNQISNIATDLYEKLAAQDSTTTSGFEALETKLSDEIKYVNAELDDLADSVDIKLGQQTMDFNKRLSAQEDFITDQINIINERIYEEARQSEESLAALSSEVGSLDTKLTTQINAFDKKHSSDIAAVDDKVTSLSATVSSAVGRLSNQLTTEANNVEVKLVEQTEWFNEQLEDLSASIDTKFNEHSEQFITKLNNVTVEYSNNLDTARQLLHSKIDDANSTQGTKLLELRSYTDDSITDINARISNQLEAVNTLYSELLRVETTLSSEKQECAAALKALQQSIVEKETTLSDKIDITRAELTTELSTHIDNLIEKTEATIEDLSNQLEENKDTFEQSLENQANTVDDKLVELSSALEESCANKVNLAKTELRAEIQQLTNNNSVCTEAIDRLTGETGNLAASNSQLSSDIADINKSIEGLVNTDTAISETVEALRLSTEAMDGELFTHVDKLSDRITDVDKFSKNLENRLDVDTEKLLWNIEDLQTALDNSVVDLENKVTAVEAGIAEALDNALARTKQEFTTDINTVESKLNTKIIEVNTKIAKTNETTESIGKDLDASVDQINYTIRAKNAELEKSIAGVASQISDVQEYVNDTNSKILEQAKRINNILALPDGSTTADGELLDIRIAGYNGSDYGSAGDAVRAVARGLEALEASLPTYIPANSVDGLLYENNELWLTSKGVQIGDPVTITGGSGGGGSVSTVRVTNNLPSASFTCSKGNEAWIDFTYTSYEDEVPTGDGTFLITINDKKIDTLSGVVQHGVPKRINLADYLKTGSNSVKIKCSDQFGSSRSLLYTISVVELKIESTFDAAQIFDANITFRYTVFGKGTKKTAHILLDGNEISKKDFDENASGSNITLQIPKQSHGVHTITAYITATVGTDDIRSNILTYEIICIEAGEKDALLTSSCSISKTTQGNMVSIPYMIYDPESTDVTVNLNVYSKIGGVLTKLDAYCATRKIDRTQQFWNTRQYPTGIAIFEISYTYFYLGEERIISKTYEIEVAKLEVDVSPATDSLQLYLHANGKSNSVENPAIWEFTRSFLDSNGKETEEVVTTAFEGFNWSSNGWFTDTNYDTCLRLNGDARAEINFKPFEKDFKTNGKTIEFEFIVRDVNNREAIVIDCFEAEVDPETGKETGSGIGFRATPDTAFLKSSNTEVSCRYKDNERVRVSISVESADTKSKFVSIYLDGVLSGVQQYTSSTSFNQSRSPKTIRLGSPYCGLDIYNIRIYDKALTAAEVLNNYIADQTVPTTKQQLMTDNNVLDDKGNISYEQVKALGQIPIITFTGSMPTYKGDKKEVMMDFENPLDKSRSFSNVYGGPIKVEIDVQGTSSQYYVRKNWKIKLKKKDKSGNTIFDHAAYQHMDGQIPAKVFCIKVDYAEATGTHNTGTANYVETLYDKSVTKDANGAITSYTGAGWIPPQKDDHRVRTTIAGFPCIIFEKATEDSEPVFSSKGNFNYDKDAEEAFGFTEEYNENYGVECWEFKNNTSDAVNFAGEIPDNWLDDFEPRYIPEFANFDRIEELQKLANNGTIIDAQRTELASLRSNAIANFKQMHDWVVSTATFELEQVLDENKEVIGTKKIPLSAEKRQERLDKFKNEFENYFNMHYSSIYYVYTFFALMVDQRAKNLFLTRWKDDDGVYRWYPYFYDNDTIFGINNEGALVFDYYHEDTDQLGSSNVYNGQNSVLWNNFRECFQDKIQEMYAKLRSDAKLDYDVIVDSYITKGSDKWSAAIYNADADYKYVSMAREQVDHTDEEGNKVEGLDASNLYQVRGPGEHHLRYFAANRLNYCDSKWNAGDYPSDFFFLRIYTPQLAEITDDMSDAQKEELRQSNARIEASLAKVPASPNITVTPFSDMYAGVKYKANGTLQQERLAANESYEFAPPNANEIFNDTETAIYGASSLASLGDLSGLYCGVINLVGKNSGSTSAVQGNVKENKLVELIIGNKSSDYHNDNFKEIEVGTCRLLQKIDLRNCSGLGIAGANPQKTLNLTGCPNIEEIYTEGTNLTLVELPDGGYVKTLHLPASTNTLVIKNQQYISDFQIESYANIRRLQIVNSNLNTADLLEKCRDSNGKYTVVNVSLTDIQLGTKEKPVTTDFVKSLFAKYNDNGELISGIRGLDDDKQAYIKGTCYIEDLSGEDYAEIKSYYKDLTINFGSMTSVVTFKYTNEAGIAQEELIPVISKNSQSGEVTDFVPIYTPDWPENIVFNYEFIGWSLIEQKSDGINDDVYEDEAYLRDKYPDAFNNSSLKGILGNRTLYPVFKAIRKSYAVTFVNITAPENERTLGTITVPYGYTADYSELGLAIPKKLDGTDPDVYCFVGWYSPYGDIDYITEGHEGLGLTFEAQFAVADQDGPNGDDADAEPGYTIGWADIGLYIDADRTEQLGYTLNNTAKTMAITRCSNTFNTVMKVPETLSLDGIDYTVTSIGGKYNGGFQGHGQLKLIYLPDTLTKLDSYALYGCNNLYELYLPASITEINSMALAACTGLSKIAVAEDNSKYSVVNNCLIEATRDLNNNITNKNLVLGLATGQIPDDVTSLGTYCFKEMPIETAIIPDEVRVIPNNAFNHCEFLADVKLPENLQTIDSLSFSWCLKLSEIDLPKKQLQTISTYAFYSCALSTVEIPATVTTINDRAFGGMTTLKTVKFSDGFNIGSAFIDHNAFYGSGQITFNVPWTKNQHSKFVGTYKDINKIEHDKDIFFGAQIGSQIIFADNVVITKAKEVENGTGLL